MSTPRVVFLWSEAKGLHGAADFSGGTVDTPPLAVLSWVSDSFFFCFFLDDRCRSSCGGCLEDTPVGVGSGGRGQLGEFEGGKCGVDEPLSAV